MTAPPNLNPGIAKMVALLTDLGFRTCDSGDGETHDHECDREYGYVTMLSPPSQLVEEAKRLKAALLDLGLKPAAQTLERPPPEGTCFIQAMYCPVDGVAILDLMYVHDRMIKTPPNPSSYTPR